MKKILFLLLLITVGLQAQTLQNPTFGNTTTNTLKIKTPATVSTVNFLSTNEADGSVSKIAPINVNIPYVPVNYSAPTQTIGNHLLGIDTRLGQISTTGAGLTQRVYFTADNTVVNSVTYFASSISGKGSTATGSPPSLVLPDNTKAYFTKDVIGIAQPSSTIGYAGTYGGNLTVSATPTPVATQQRFTVEIYRTNNLGTPIASGVSGAPVGDLGVTVLAILDSGIINLSAGSITNVPVSGILTQNITINTGERLRYHVSAAKIGTGGGNVTFGVYYGSSYNSYYDVPVAITTDAVLNKTPLSGVTLTDVINNLDASVIHKTLNETKTGTLGVNGLILNTNVSDPASTDGIMYKLTQSTTAGQSWSTTYNPVLTRYNGLTDYVRNKPATYRKKLMVTGSSVAYGVGATANNGWANRLSVDLIAKGWLYTNHAIGGNTTTDVINRFYTDVTPENPDILIIGLSLGNEGIMGSGKEAVYDSFKKSLQKLVQMCRQHDIIPVIANCYPRNEYTSVEYGYVNQMNKELDSWGVPVINLMGAVDDLTGKFVAGSFDPDGLHPNDLGHQEMYKTVPPSMFDCLMNWDEKRLIPEKGAIKIISDGTTERPLETVFDGALSSFTFSFWMKSDDVSASGKAIAGFGTGASRITNSGGIGLRYITTSATSVNFGVFPEVTKNWYHVAITYNAITQKLRTYLNGVFMGEVTDNITLSRLVLGGRSDTGQASFNSSNTNFKDVAIYRARMTDIQVKELYSGNILKSSLEIFSPLSDKDVAKTRRMLNFSPTYSYLKVNSDAFVSIDKGVINTDIVSQKIASESVIISTDPATASDGAKLRVSGVVNAEGGIARGVYTSATATATSNNDILTGVYISTTFNPGVFTGVQTVPLRILNRGTLGNLSLGTTGQGGQISFARGSDGLTQGFVGYNTANDNGDLVFSSASVNGILGFLTNSIRQGQFYNSGNFALQTGGTFTDNGVDKLQVTGTASGTVDATLSNQFVRKGQLDLKADLASPALTGTPTAPTATAGTNTTQIATTAFVQSATRPYKSYSAFVSQTGTSAPVATVMENNTGATVAWARTSTGVYTATFSSAVLTSNKVLCFVTNGVTGSSANNSSAGTSSTSVVAVGNNVGGVLTDINADISIEIRIYP